MRLPHAQLLERNAAVFTQDLVIVARARKFWHAVEVALCVCPSTCAERTVASKAAALTAVVGGGARQEGGSSSREGLQHSRPAHELSALK